MARVITVNLNMSSGSKWGELRLDINPGASDIANNTTPITYELYLQRTATNFGGYYSNYDSTANLTINGTSISVPNFTYNFSTNYKKSLQTGSMTIAHNADGSKTISASASVNPTGNVPSGSGSGSLALTTIPRASSFTLSGSTETGSAISVSISRASTSFTHRVRWRIGSGSWTTVSSDAATSASFTVPHSAFPNSTSGAITVAVQTYSDSTVIGNEQTRTWQLNVPASVVPSFTTITHSEYVSLVNTEIGAYVQNKTRLNLAITGASAGSGSSIKSYKITVDGQNANTQSGVTQVIRSSGTLNIVGTVTDNRNRSTSKTVKITVLPYQNPTLESIDLMRSTSTGTQDPFGTFARLRIKSKVSSLDGKNSATYQVRSKVSPSGSWTTKTATTTIGVKEAKTNTYSGYAVTDEYQFEVVITDKLGSQTIMNDLLFLSTGGVPFFTGYDGIASSFGKIPTHGATYDLEVGDKGMRVDGELIDKNGKEVLSHRGIFIPTGADLNNYEEPGFYYNHSNAEVATMLNSPLARSFSMLVTNHAGVAQFWVEYVADGKQRIFTRNKYGTSWSNWLEIYHSGNRPMKWQHNITVTNGTNEILMFNFINWSDVPYTTMSLVASALYGTAHTNKENAMAATGVIVRSGANRFISGVFAPSTVRLDYVYAESSGAISVSNTAGWSSAVIKDYMQSV